MSVIRTSIEPVLRNRERGIPSLGLWSIFIRSSDRLIAIKLASVLHLSVSFTHVVTCKYHYFEIKIYETGLFLRIVSQLVTNLLISFWQFMYPPTIASPYSGSQESGPAFHNTFLSSLFNITLSSVPNSCTCILLPSSLGHFVHILFLL